MPDAIITSTESTFGTISGTFLETGATIQGTITGVVAGTLDGSVGVPGPAGSPGATGPQGQQGIQGVPGAPGVGVPAGGTAGQILAKVDGTNYNTQWVNDSGAVVWGNITGTLSNQTDLQTALNGKYPTSNPAGYITSSALSGYATESWVTAGFYPLIGNPSAFLQAAALEPYLTIQSASETYYTISNPANYISAETAVATFYPLEGNPSNFITVDYLTGYAPLASPAFTGNPTAPTAPIADNDTSIATTAFVQQELASGTAVAKNLEVYVRNQTGATLTAGTIVYINGATGNRPTITKAQANNDANSAQTFGFVKASITNNGFGYVIVRGELENVDTSALTEGVQLYLSPTVAGTWTTTKPSAPQHLVYVGICVRAHPTQGVILVAVQNGYELDELHDVQIVSPTNGQVLKYDSATGLWKNATDSAGVAWGGITGTLSSQTDLQTALDGKYSTSNPAGYITSSALSPYLLSSTAASTYQTLAGMSAYLTTSAAASTYYPLTNPSGYITSSALSGYATESFVTSQGYITSAALSPYLLKAGGTMTGDLIVQDAGGLDPSSYIKLREATTGEANRVEVSASNNSAYSLIYPGTITVSVDGETAYYGPTSATLNGSDVVTQATGSGLYYPLTGNPSGFITSSALSPYLTSATASATYLAKASNLSDLTSASTARTNLGLGTAAVESANRLVPAGGTTGQVLAKSSNADWDDAWITIPSAPVTSVAGRTGAITLSTSDISGLGTMATQTAANYSTTAVANGLYYPLSGNPSGFLTSASLSGYATESFVTSQGYITSSALTPYLTSATAASTYQTITGMSSYLTTSAAASTYYLQTNPSGYLNTTAIGGGSAVAGADILDALQESNAPSTGNPYATQGDVYTQVTSMSATLLAKSSNLSDLASASLARGNLGLGTAAVEPATKLVPAGGTTGQVLVKASNSDWDDTWATPSNNVKAWVNFNGTGTVAIRGSYNVTSITDNGVGDYTINFTTAMADTNYAVSLAGRRSNSADINFAVGFQPTATAGTNYPLTTTTCRVACGTPTNFSYLDTDVYCVSVFR